MKIGYIFECPRDGTDEQVYSKVINRLCPGMEFVVQSAGNNKREMIDQCGIVAQLLLSEGCDLIAIVWDLVPPWGDIKACRKADKAAILANLRSAGVEENRVKLICIEPELEGWLVFDGRPLTAYKKQLSHPHPTDKFNGAKLKPTSENAKTVIHKYLGRKYNDVSEAVKIVEHIKDFSRIAKHPSFGRLKKFIDDNCR